MIEAVLSGKLIKDAEAKVSAGGKDYLLLIIRHDEQLVRVMLFGDDIPAVESLRKGDSCAVAGSLTVGEWNGKPSLSMMAHRAISPAMRKPKREKAPDMTPSRSQALARGQSVRSGELSDDVPW
jgi:single-stranded DNA-binding protein